MAARTACQTPTSFFGGRIALFVDRQIVTQLALLYGGRAAVTGSRYSKVVGGSLSSSFHDSSSPLPASSSISSVSPSISAFFVSFSLHSRPPRGSRTTCPRTTSSLLLAGFQPRVLQERKCEEMEQGWERTSCWEGGALGWAAHRK